MCYAGNFFPFLAEVRISDQSPIYRTNNSHCSGLEWQCHDIDNENDNDDDMGWYDEKEEDYSNDHNGYHDHNDDHDYDNDFDHDQDNYHDND